MSTSFTPAKAQPGVLDRTQVVVTSNVVIDKKGKIRFFTLLDTAHFDSKLVHLRRSLDRVDHISQHSAIDLGLLARIRPPGTRRVEDMRNVAQIADPVAAGPVIEKIEGDVPQIAIRRSLAARDADDAPSLLPRQIFGEVSADEAGCAGDQRRVHRLTARVSAG